MFSTGVVAHAARADQAQALVDTVAADYLSVDNGTLGCSGNHQHVWHWLQDHNPNPWSVVLEDDALPVDDFRTQLGQALTVAPTPIVSLYLGTGRPPQWQHRVEQAIRMAEQDNACWILSRRLLHGVAICIRTNLIPSMLQYIESTPRPIDWAIRDWAVNHQHQIGFTTPSLVDHQDGPTLIPATGERTDSLVRDQPRTAWRVGTRTRWTSKAIDL